MANYNTFALVNTKTRKIVLTTSSARKAYNLLEAGKRIDVWNNNKLIDVIYKRNEQNITPYIKLEKEYIAKKQQLAELRNKRRRGLLVPKN